MTRSYSDLNCRVKGGGTDVDAEVIDPGAMTYSPGATEYPRPGSIGVAGKRTGSV